jgi:hypothetical protein
LYIGYWVSAKPSSTSCWEMTPSLSSPTLRLFRFLSRAFSRLPSILQSALQYFSLNQPRNLRLQTRHVFRTLWSVVSSACSLPFYCLIAPLFYPRTGIKSKCTYAARTGPSVACLCLVSPLVRLIVRAKAKLGRLGLRGAVG